MVENQHHAGGAYPHALPTEGESVELHMLALIYGVDMDTMRELIAIHGLDREALDRATGRPQTD
ncbi:hypothetical protein [Phenylobacterium sp.]|uniref:hypothetical protein n=1 Tax=Phenylobacterium sp. TaxID=1871053 RepID=UPI0027333B24|nr:hypothetical protein [Phenylobacterium sp.]MDP3658583.1 hypothetical protein [Phenylobacterium sp.]